MYKTTITIEGMRCPMCEAHVNDKIRESFDVQSVKASHKKGNCEIVSENELSEDAVKAAIDDTGYTFVSFRSETYVKKGLFSRK